MDVRRIVGVLLRFKWLILGVTIVFTALGYGASRFVKPIYVAQTTIYIDQGNRRGAGAAGAFQTPESFSPEAWVSLLRSYAVLDSVVTDLRLFLLPDERMDSAMVASFAVVDPYSTGTFHLVVDGAGHGYVLSTDKGLVVDRGPVGGPVGARLGFKWMPPASAMHAGASYNFSVLSIREAAKGLADALRPTIDRDGNFLTVELQGSSPSRIVATLNSAAANFVRVAANLKQQNLGDRNTALADQLRSAQTSLANAESALERFRLQGVADATANPLPPASVRPGSPDGADAAGATSAYFAMRVAVDSVQQEIQSIQQILAAAPNAPQMLDDLARLASVQKSVVLMQALKELADKRAVLATEQKKYTDEHPAVQQAKGDVTRLEQQAIPQLARTLASQLEAHQRDLQHTAETATQVMRSIPSRAIEGARLERNVRLAEGLATTLQQRYGEAQLAEVSNKSDVRADVRVLDLAVEPQYPEKNTRRQVIFVAFMGGLGLAGAGALLLDRMDPRFRYPTQVSRELGLTILGAVPFLRGKGNERSQAEAASEFREALRAVRMNVEYSYGAAGVLAVTISSPGASDGKSFLSLHLARSFAESGRRTVLIDADLRRGRLHHQCEVQRKPGITDCLRGTATIDRILQHTKYQRLDLVTSGTRAHEAPELLSSPAMAQLVGELRTRYEVIICDSPPLAAGIDPFVLATLTSNLVLVVRTGVSLREMTGAKMEVLDRMPVRVLGAVLNAVPRDSVYAGYYSHYLPGYDTSDEGKGVALPPIVM